MPFQERPLPSELRAHPRYPCSRQVLVQLKAAPAGSPTSLVVQDISAQGLCLLMDSPRKLGTALKVGVHHLNPPHLLLARVVYAAKRHLGWLIGCELSGTLGEGKIQEFLG